MEKVGSETLLQGTHAGRESAESRFECTRTPWHSTRLRNCVALPRDIEFHCLFCSVSCCPSLRELLSWIHVIDAENSRVANCGDHHSRRGRYSVPVRPPPM